MKLQRLADGTERKSRGERVLAVKLAFVTQSHAKLHAQNTARTVVCILC
jgi:hypothetical protein